MDWARTVSFGNRESILCQDTAKYIGWYWVRQDAKEYGDNKNKVVLLMDEFGIGKIYF